MGHRPIQEVEVFRQFEEVAEWGWAQVSEWPSFVKYSVGDQLVRAVDSINANLVEGDGRFSVADGLRFFVIARASARETRLWRIRAQERGLVPEDEVALQIAKLIQATKGLNVLIGYRRGKGDDGIVREETPSYFTSADPFAA